MSDISVQRYRRARRPVPNGFVQTAQGKTIKTLCAIYHTGPDQIQRWKIQSGFPVRKYKKHADNVDLVADGGDHPVHLDEVQGEWHHVK